MPALPVVANVMRIDLKGTITGGGVFADRIFVRYATALSSADAATIATGVGTAWNTNLAPIISNNATLQTVTVTDLASVSGAQSVQSTVHAGTDAAATMPGASSVVVRFKIARRYRGGHPRFYLGPIASGHSANPDQWSAGFLTTVLADWNAFVNAVLALATGGTGALTHVNVSYFSGFSVVTNPITHRARNVPSLRIAGPATDSVSSYSVNPNIASQRRRNHQNP